MSARQNGARVSFALAIASMVAGYWLASRYSARLSDHRGVYLVEAPNTPATAPRRRPRRVVVVVVDGLRRDLAQTMRAAQVLAQRGSCMPTDVGPLTLSRPVYALLSTGLEVDRTGARSNRDDSPLAAESIWEVGRAAGLRVHGASDQPFWQELFPSGFDRFDFDDTHELDVSSRVELGDLTLLHTSRVDAAGHDRGASSADYRAAVARVDGEIVGLLARLDLARDAVILTADHGHTPRGGHGGSGDDVRVVWTCMAGAGLRSRDPPPLLDARVLAPALAVLLGIPFPRHMRAGDDQLDSVWELVDVSFVGPDYAAERKRDIRAARAINGQALEAWLGGAPGTWPRLYARERRAQRMRAAIAALVILLGLAMALRVRGYAWPRVALGLAWMVVVVALGYSLYAWLRGGLDLSSINLRMTFVAAGSSAIASSVAVCSLAHLWRWRDFRALTADLLCLAVSLVAVGFAQLVVYGAPLGFPVPSPMELFAPYLTAAFVLVLGGLVALSAAVSMVFGRRGTP